MIYIAGEVRNPERNISRALIWGTTLITMLYLLLCVAYLSVLGLDGLRHANEAGTASAAVSIPHITTIIANRTAPLSRLMCVPSQE